MKTLVEIVVCSAEDAVEAEAGGADRVELCNAIELGGLTPSLGALLETKARTRLPIAVMIRPRPGGFCYGQGEFATMQRNADLLVAQGVDGLVTGVLMEDGRVDVRRCRWLLAHSSGTPLVFHRAFDATPDPFEALETIIDLGFSRILTSGQRPAAIEGAHLIRELVERADGRIEILPGGGIRAHNVREVVARTGSTQVHLAPFSSREDPSTRQRPEIGYGEHRTIDRAAVAEVVEALKD